MNTQELLDQLYTDYFSCFDDYINTTVLTGHGDTRVITAHFSKPSLVGVMYLAYKIECQLKVQYPNLTVTTAAAIYGEIDDANSVSCIVIVIREGG